MLYKSAFSTPTLMITLALAFGFVSTYIGSLDVLKIAILVSLLGIFLVSFALGTKKLSLLRKALLFVFTLTVALPITYSFKTLSGSDIDIARPLPSYLQVMLVHVVASILLGIYASKHGKPNFYWSSLVTPLGIFVFISLLSATNSNNANPSASFWGSIFIASIVIFILIAVNSYSFDEVFVSVWLGFVCVVFLQTCFVIAYPILGIEEAATIFSKTAANWMARGELPRAVGTTDHPGMLSLYLGSILPFFVSSYLLGYRRKLSLFVIAMLATDILLTQARTTIVASLIASLVVAFALQFRGNNIKIFKGFVFSLIIAAFFILFVLQTKMGQSMFVSDSFRNMWLARYYHWDLGLRLVREHFFLGVGFNSHVDYIAKNIYLASFLIVGADFVYTNPIHNSHLVIFSELGVFGYMSWLAIYLLLIKHGYGFLSKARIPKENRIVFGGVLGSVITMLLYAFFDWGLLRPIMWFQLAILIIMCDRAKVKYCD